MGGLGLWWWCVWLEVKEDLEEPLRSSPRKSSFFVVSFSFSPAFPIPSHTSHSHPNTSTMSMEEHTLTDSSGDGATGTVLHDVTDNDGKPIWPCSVHLPCPCDSKHQSQHHHPLTHDISRLLTSHTVSIASAAMAAAAEEEEGTGTVSREVGCREWVIVV